MTVQRMRSILSGPSLLFGYLQREGGNVAAIMAILLVPLIGALSMSVEASSWFFMGRSAQNAADSAAVAAANNGVPAEYMNEGRAAANKYGFIDGQNGATVTVASGVACPDATTGCYQATVTRKVPIYLTRFIGFTGDTTIGGKPYKTISNTALAELNNIISFPACIQATGSDSAAPGNGSNQIAITGSGTPNANASGCSLAAVGASPSSIACSGSNGLGAQFGFATGSISGSGNHTCVTQATTNSNFRYCDPYAATPATGCTTGTMAAAAASAASATTAACPSGLSGLSANCRVSGNLTLTANVNPTNPTVVVISNGGNLTMGSYSSNNVTYIFTGSPPGTFASSSPMTLTAPTSSPTGTTGLSGVAAYQIASTACTHSTCDTWNETGNYPVNITGLVYLPYTNANFGGTAGISSSGNCFIATFNSFATNGTGYVLDRSGCTAAGLGGLPTVQRYRAALVK